MLRIRKILLTLSLVIGVGTLGSSLAYAWYLHSDIYRQSLRRRVGEYLGLPVEIGRVRPLTLRSKSLQDIKVYLPDRRVQIFECAAALWKEQPGEGEIVFELELKGGALIIGADRWNRPDYRRVFESGFAHDFSDLNLKRVWLSDMDVQVIRKGWTLRIDDATGTVVFNVDDGLARVNLESKTINDYQVSDSISVSASLTPGETVKLHEVVLTVPRMPVTNLKLDDMLRTTITRGFFQGKIVYQEGDSRVLEIIGRAEDLSLPELTAMMPGGGIAGQVEQLDIDRARIVDGRLQLVEFSGELCDLQLSDVAAIFDQINVQGLLDLQVTRGVILDGQIAELEAHGSVIGVDPLAVTQLWGLGRITGQLNLTLDHLRIVNDQIESAEIVVVMEPPQDRLPTIDRRVISLAAESIFETELPNLPVDDLEYVNLGARLVIRDQQLRIKGLYGDGQQTILSIRLLGSEVPLIRAPSKVFELKNLIAIARDQARQYDFSQLLHKQTSPTKQESGQ